MGVKNARKYTSEFKQQAVALADSLGSADAAAERLGIPISTVHGWRGKARKGQPLASSVHQEMKSTTEADREELRRLRKENEDLKRANYILKRAAAFFSQDHLK